MTILYLVRHGLTQETGKKLSGRLPGVHLSEDGIAQARAVADYLKGVRLEAVYSSPIERALETARIIASSHGLPVKTRRGIAEVDFGDWTGKTFGVLRRTKLWATVQRWPSGARFPDGESFSGVQTRAVAEVEGMRSEHSQATLCCVSHGDVIKLIAAHYMGLHIDMFQRLVIAPGSVAVVSVAEGGAHMVAWNASPVCEPFEG